MGGEFYAVLGSVWELRLGHEDQCEGNEMQFVRCHEACDFIQSGEATGKRLHDTAMQSLQLSTLLLLRPYSDSSEALAIHVSWVLVPTVCLRSAQTSVDPKSGLREADLAMRSVQTINVAGTSGCNRQQRRQVSR